MHYDILDGQYAIYGFVRWKTSWLNLSANSKNRSSIDPPIDTAPIVSNLIPLSADGLDDMEVLASLHLT